MSLLDRFKAAGGAQLGRAITDAEVLRGRFARIASTYERGAEAHAVHLIRQGLRAGAAHARSRVQQLGRLLNGLRRIQSVAFPDGVGLAPAVIAAIALGAGVTVYTAGDVARVLVDWGREADAMEATTRREAQLTEALRTETDPERRKQLAEALVHSVKNPLKPAGASSSWWKWVLALLGFGAVVEGVRRLRGPNA